jgi:hypothetical protein
MFTLAGTVGVSIQKIGNLSVKFGNNGNPGLIITDGSLTSLDMTIDSNITVGSATFYTTGLQFTYAASNSMFTLAGTVGVSIKSIGGLSVTFGQIGETITLDGFGNAVTAGNYNYYPASFQLRSAFTTSGKTYDTTTVRKPGFYPTGLSATPQNVTVDGFGVIISPNASYVYYNNGVLLTSPFTSGPSTFPAGLYSAGWFPAAVSGNTNSTAQFQAAATTVTKDGFGDLIKNGTIYKWFPNGLTLTQNFGIAPATKTAGVYQAGFYPATVVTQSQSVHFKVGAFSDSSYKARIAPGATGATIPLAASITGPQKPGLVITDGSLISLDMTINSTITISSAKFYTYGLRFTYDSQSDLFTLGGTVGIQVGTKISAQVSFGRPAQTLSTDGSGQPLAQNSSTNYYYYPQGYMDANGNYHGSGMYAIDTTKDGFGEPLISAENKTYVYYSANFQTNRNYTENQKEFPAGTYPAGLYPSDVSAVAVSPLTAIPTQRIYRSQLIDRKWQIPVPASPGIVISGGSLVSLDMTLDSNLKFGSVEFYTKGLEFTYVANSSVFTLIGSCGINITNILDLKVTFGHGAMTVTHDGAANLLLPDTVYYFYEYGFTNPSKVYQAAGLYRTAPSNTTNLQAYTTGKAVRGTVSVTLAGSPGLVLSNGELVSIDMTLDTNIKMGPATFTTTGLQFKYDVKTTSFSLAGSVGLTIRNVLSCQVTFGEIQSNGSYSTGLIISPDLNSSGIPAGDPQLQYLNLHITASVTVQGLDFGVDNLGIVYTKGSDRWEISGSASLGIGTFAKVTVGFGSKSRIDSHTRNTIPAVPGLVIERGELTQLNITTTATLDLGFAKIHSGLSLDWLRTTNQFGLSGYTTIDIPSIGNLSVTFGDQTKPLTDKLHYGLLIVDGQLTYMHLTVNAEFRFGGFTFKVDNLALDYQYIAPINAYVETKTVKIFGFSRPYYVYHAAQPEQTLFTMSGSARVMIPVVGKLDVLFGTTNAPGLVIKNGALDSFQVAIKGDISFAGFKFSTASGIGLFFNYKDGGFHVTGQAKLTILGYDIPLDFGVPGDDFVFDSNGNLIEIDIMQIVEFEFLGAKIKGDLHFIYHRAEGSAPAYFTLTGDMSITMGGLTVKASLGGKHSEMIANLNWSRGVSLLTGGLIGTPLVKEKYTSSGLKAVNGSIQGLDATGNVNLILPLGSILTLNANAQLYISANPSDKQIKLIASGTAKVALDLGSGFKLSVGAEYALEFIHYSDGRPSKICVYVPLGAGGSVYFEVVNGQMQKLIPMGAAIVAAGFAVAGKAIVSAAKSVPKAIGKEIASWFGFGPVDGGFVYYDPGYLFDVSTAVMATTTANGEFLLTLPAGTNQGQLVAGGGTDISTGLPNRLVATAPYDAKVINTLTSLVNSLMRSKNLTEPEATGYINSSMGLPLGTQICFNNSLLTAVGGDPLSGAAYQASLSIDTLTVLIASLVSGEPGSSAFDRVCVLAYQEIADWIYTTGGSLRLLRQESVLSYLLGKVANAAGVNLEAADLEKGGSLIEGFLAHIASVTADGTQSSLDQMTKAYVVANGDLFTQLSLVGSGFANLDDLLSQYSGSALSQKLSAAVAGPLFAGPPQITVQQTVVQPVGAGDPPNMNFSVYLATTGPLTAPVTVDFTTWDATATSADGDYVPVQGTLTWLPGDTAPKTISVPLNVTHSGQANQLFGVHLSNSQNASISQNGLGLGLIQYTDYSTQTSVTASSTSVGFGDTVTLTAAVSIDGLSQSTAVGSVTFTLPDGTVLGTADLVNGQASIVTSSLPAGNDLITATYSGSITEAVHYKTSAGSLVEVVAMGSQTMTFGPLENQTYPGTQFIVEATASSELPVFYRIVSGPAILHDNLLIITGTGTVEVEASQPGGLDYAAATPVLQSFVVSKPHLTYTVDNQTITYGSQPSTFGGSFSGFLNGDDTNVVTSLPDFAVESSVTGAGLYAIDANSAVTANYQIDYVSGTLTVTQAITDVVLSAPATGAFGQSITLSATVTHPDGTVAPTGTVGFYNNGVKLGDATLANGVATLVWSNWNVGHNNLTGLYSGDNNYLSSGSIDTDLVIQNEATVSLVGSVSTVLVNHSSTYTATIVSAGDGQPLTTGTVQFQVDGIDLGDPVALDILGRASFTVNPLTEGSHTIMTNYSGNDTTPAATGSLVQSVVRDSGAVTLQSSKTSLLMGQGVTYTAAVTSDVDGRVLTTGTIQFQMDGVDQGSPMAVDGSGLASFTADSLSAGTHVITAIYSGDSEIDGATQTFSQSVIQDTSAANLGSSIVHPLAGTTPTFTATVSSSITGLPLTTGTVQFAVNGVNHGSPVALDGTGTASFTIEPVSVGTYTLTAVYSGDVNTVGSTQTLSLSVAEFAATTSLVSPATTSTYGQSVTYMAQVLPADATQGTPAGIVQFVVDGVATGSPVTIDANGNASSQSLSLSGGDHVILAVYTSSNGFQGGSDQSGLTVQQVDQTISFGSLGNATFGDAPIALSGTSSSGLAVTFTLISGAGYISNDSLFITGTGAIVVAAEQSGDGNYNAATAVEQTLTVSAGSTTTTLLSSTPNSTYGDLVSVTATVSASGVTPDGQVQFVVDGVNYGAAVTLSFGSASVNLPVDLAAGTCTITATFIATTDLNTSTADNLSQTVAQAQAVIDVTGYTVTYDGTAHSATGFAYALDGSLLSGLTLSATTHTNAVSILDTWTFHDPSGNYADASGTVANIIGQATASITVTGLIATYNAAAQAATGSATGLNGIDLSSGLTLTGTTHTDAGVYLGDTWTFHDPQGNYADASGLVDNVISQATASITVTGYNVTYDTSVHVASGSATGLGSVDLSSGLTLTGTTHTNAGVYTGDAWTFQDASGNYADASGTVTNVIGQASATITVTPYATTYDTYARTSSGIATGLNSLDLSSGLTLTETTHTNAGTYNGDRWTFHDILGNYADSSGTVNNSIEKATATITITPYTITGTTYDGNSHTATGTATGIGNANLSSGLILTGTTHTNAGTYTGDTWSFAGGVNYISISETISNSIAQATANIVVTPYNSPFDGNAHTATGTASGIGSVNLYIGLTLTGTTHTSAGVYLNDPWSFHDVAGNYADASGTVNNAIGSAPAVTTSPMNTTVTAGVTASFTVVGTGAPAPTIQWQVSTNSGSTWSNIADATAGTYSVSTVKSQTGSQYRAVLTNVFGVVTSNVATLTVNARPLTVGTTFTTTVFTGLNTGIIKLVDIIDSMGVTLPTNYTATINWGDGRTDSNIVVAHPNTDGTAVHVVGSHTYTVGGTYRPIITLVDAAGSTLVTLASNTAKLIVGTDVSNKVSITRSSPVKNRTTGFWAQTVTMNNISGVDLKGNIDLVLIGLTTGVSLSGATGYTAGGANPYVRFSTTGLKAGKSISLVLKFAIPTTITAFNYSFKTFTN